jgi:pilus assembly protein CpaE
MSRFVLATPDHDFEDRVKQALSVSNGAVRRLDDDALDLDPDQAVTAITGPQGTDTGVVVLGPGLPVAAALEIAALFDRERPDVSMVLVAAPTPKLWEQAMRAGIRDVVDMTQGSTRKEAAIDAWDAPPARLAESDAARQARGAP